LFLLSCNKEKWEQRKLDKAEKELRNERKDILEVNIVNHRSAKIADIQISLANRDNWEITSNPVHIQDVEPGEEIMFLYNCQGKIPKGAGVDMGFELRYKLDALDSIEKLNFLGVYDGTIHVRGLQLDFYDDTIVFTPLIWKW